MFKRRYLWGFLATLLAIGLLVGGGFAIGRLAWWQGYQAGLAQGGGEGPHAAPGLPFGPWTSYRWPRVGFSPALFGLAALFRVGLLALLFVGLARLFHLWGRRAAGGPVGDEARTAYWAKRWHQHHPHGWERPPGWQESPGPHAGEKAADGAPEE